jgi:hypothetical protein
MDVKRDIHAMIRLVFFFPLLSVSGVTIFLALLSILAPNNFFPQLKFHQVVNTHSASN